ncbi:MAG: hypothetical protein QNJ42_17665, partial [Crocosphaera sp.]|nr:hypothetical protein [Crocosphaera sp.]
MENFIDFYNSENLDRETSRTDIILPHWHEESESSVNIAPLLIEEIEQWIEEFQGELKSGTRDVFEGLVPLEEGQLLGNEIKSVTIDELIHTSSNQLTEQLKTLEFEKVIAEKIGEINKELEELLREDNWTEKLQEIFGESWKKETGKRIIEELIEENKWPEIELIPGNILGSQGGYAQGKQTIYLAKELEEEIFKNPHKLGKIIAEELGHYLDEKLNGVKDSKGDEGRKFSALLDKEKVELVTQKRWGKENDYRQVDLLGEAILIEQSTNEISGTIGRDILEGTSLSDRIIGGFSADIITGGTGEDIFVYENIRDAGDIIKDFEIGQDKIDLTIVLETFGYTGNNPLEDGYVVLGEYSQGTIVYLDSDGIGGNSPRPYIQVETVTPTQLESQLEHFCPYPVTENQPPTVSLDNIINSLNENLDTTNPIKVADILITDDGEGSNNLGLTGDDAEFFEIVGTELFLKAGTSLNFEAKNSYDITVTVDDVTVGDTPDDSVAYSLTITDVNQPPTVALDNTINSLNENLDTTNPIKVADILITDDGEGSNNLGLTGDDAEFFEIVGTELFLKAG